MWPSGKALGSGPRIGGSNPSTLAKKNDSRKWVFFLGTGDGCEPVNERSECGSFVTEAHRNLDFEHFKERIVRSTYIPLFSLWLTHPKKRHNPDIDFMCFVCFHIIIMSEFPSPHSISPEEAAGLFAMQLQILDEVKDEFARITGGNIGVANAVIVKMALAISEDPWADTTPERIREITGAPEADEGLEEWRIDFWDRFKFETGQ